MSELKLCEACRRHILVSEHTCPFCSEQVTKRSSLGSARTVILASALAGASALGCSDERPATKAPPPVPATPAVVIDAAPVAIDAAQPSDAALPDAGAVDAAVAKKRKKRKKADPAEAKDNITRPVPIPNMPYGAPPARRRIV